jgi:hypothetical protein
MSRSLAGWGGLLVLILGLAACGGGGGGGGPSPPTQPTASVTFTPATSGVPAIRLERNGTGATTLNLDVVADGVTNLYGVAFDLSYPANLLRFDGASEGPFLAATGLSTELLVDAAGGRLVVGATRLGAVGGAAGTGSLLTLRFTAVGSGTGTFAFSANQAFNPVGNPLGGITWAGGTVRTQL